MNTSRESFQLDLERTTSTELEEVVICSKCNGYGSSQLKGDFIVYGNDTDLKQNNICSSCNGTGKLIKQTVVSFVSFDPNLAIKTHIVSNPENFI